MDAQDTGRKAYLVSDEVDKIIAEANEKAERQAALERATQLRQTILKQIANLKGAQYNRREVYLYLRGMYLAAGMTKMWPFIRYQLRKRWGGL